MWIGVEASRANRAQRTGVEWYACHLMRELAALPEAASHQWTAYTETPLRPDLRAWIPGWQERVLRWPPKYLWTQVRLSLEMHFRPPQVLFVPAHVLPRALPEKAVVTVHDVGFKRFPKLYKPIQVAYHEITTRDIVASKAKIITVSEFSKREIIELYGASPNQIEVTPLGLDTDRYCPQTEEARAAVREKYGLDRPFLLFVGRLEEKKNILRLVQGFCEAMDASNNDALLVLAGMAGHGWGEAKAWLAKHPRGGQVRVLGYLSEADKPALTAAADWYIQASLYEGFGLPVLEAMACETPVLCANAGSLPEVVGSAKALFFDPLKVPEIASRIVDAFALSRPEYLDMVRLGREHAPKFTWKRTAEATLPILLS